VCGCGGNDNDQKSSDGGCDGGVGILDFCKNGGCSHGGICNDYGGHGSYGNDSVENCADDGSGDRDKNKLYVQLTVMSKTPGNRSSQSRPWCC
jgi:hypothetical protein